MMSGNVIIILIYHRHNAIDLKSRVLNRKKIWHVIISMSSLTEGNFYTEGWLT
jgi:hypothetical protein